MNAGYYIHVEPGKSFLAGGMWMPPSDQLKKIRQEIDYNSKYCTGSCHKKILRNGTRHWMKVRSTNYPVLPKDMIKIIPTWNC